MFFRFLTFCATLILVGCASTGDLTRYESSICEIHNCPMTIQEVPCYAGWSGYALEFHSAMRKQFPHHGRVHYDQDHFYMHARRFRTHVCEECTKGYDQWQLEHLNHHPNPSPAPLAPTPAHSGLSSILDLTTDYPDFTDKL